MGVDITVTVAGERHGDDHGRPDLRMVAGVTDTRGFPELKPVEPPLELARFAAAVRRLQDLSVSTNPDGEVFTTASEQIEAVCASLEGFEVPDGHAPAGRAIELPGLGHPSSPRWTIEEFDEDGVTMKCHLSRFHVGGKRHGGARRSHPALLRLALRHDRLRRRATHQPRP